MKKMNVKIMALTLGMFTAVAAQADGFVCTARSTGAKIRVFNQTQPSDGTRSVAVMVISNPAIQSPNKTIARFTSANETLQYQGNGNWAAKVDLRYNDSKRQGELIGGTKLGYLKSIVLDLDFAYSTIAMQFAKTSETRGLIKYFKRDGDVNHEVVVCQRYLKTEI